MGKKQITDVGLPLVHVDDVRAIAAEVTEMVFNRLIDHLGERDEKTTQLKVSSFAKMYDMKESTIRRHIRNFGRKSEISGEWYATRLDFEEYFFSPRGHLPPRRKKRV